MNKLVFNNGKAIENPVMGDDYIINGNLATLKGEPNTSGFYFEQFNCKYADYSAFNTLYRQLDEKYILSNDGSVYVEPVPEPHEFTHSDIEIDGELYDGLDYSNFCFTLIKGEYDFSDVYEYSVNGELQKHLEFLGTEDIKIDGFDYTRVNFRQFSNIEVQVAKNTANIDYISLMSDIDLDE